MYLYKAKTEFLICHDVSTDYITENIWEKQPSSLLTMYNLSHTVNFTTKIQNNSSPATDNIFVDDSRLNLSSVSPLINGPSDRDVQFLKTYNLHATTNKIPLKQRTRFQLLLLKNDTWAAVYKDCDTNYIFNSFLCTLLNTFQARFPIKFQSINYK